MCEAASKHTHLQSKLQYSLQQISANKPGGKEIGQAFVPHAQRTCYGCGVVGHVLADSANLTDEEKMEKFKEVAAAAAAKSR